METFKDCSWQKHKSSLRFKKKRIEELKNNTPQASILLFQDEKGPISAKTYGGSSWNSIQAKVEHDQKVKGLLNVFGAYEYTNDKMYTHCYKQRQSSQFIDFLNKVDSLYDPTIKQVFIILDNASIHRSTKTREAMKNKRPRVVLLFLPTKTPELNLIEVRWMWMHRMAINNSTFENESDIGKAVSDWTKNYNKTHSNTTSHILHQLPISVYTYLLRHLSCSYQEFENA